MDGYNVIGAWPELSALAAESLEDARESLLHSLCNHCGYTGQTLMLVFDAHQSRERGAPRTAARGQGQAPQDHRGDGVYHAGGDGG